MMHTLAGKELRFGPAQKARSRRRFFSRRPHLLRHLETLLQARDLLLRKIGLLLRKMTLLLHVIDSARQSCVSPGSEGLGIRLVCRTRTIISFWMPGVAQTFPECNMLLSAGSSSLRTTFRE